ncbi:MAG: RNA ligase partner protein [Candidatus Heimdallarchaeota archaeon]|nr:MAG: RNA ligase partner protein [Candidatus Gerdarchaeota archaeon]RLI70643.1 MAG: RNA ligase partner protein [Candidatus Heimdallarchaeota archaeon]
MSFPRQRFVLDTTAFTDSKLLEQFGGTISDVVIRLTELISIGRLRLNISCYMPPSTFKELKEFLLENKCSLRDVDQVEAWVVRKTPDRYSVMLSSHVIYEYVSDVRKRLDQGMSIVRKAIKEALKYCEKNIFEDNHSKNIKDIEHSLTRNFEEKYRQKMRRGVLDSLPDIDTLILAKELNAGVVSADSGIKAWAERMGIRFVEASFFPQIILTYLERLEDFPEALKDYYKLQRNNSQ